MSKEVKCQHKASSLSPRIIPILLLVPAISLMPVSPGHLCWNELKPLNPPASISPASPGQGLRGELSSWCI